MNSAQYWITQLNLLPHPEGGFFKETYRAPGIIPHDSLPACFTGPRSFATAIYFLLRSQDRSVFHRIKSDELWHYHAGGVLSIYVLQENGLRCHKLGPNPEKGESLQIVIPAGCWFGARVEESESFVLSGCTVAPGFDFADFEMAERSELLKTFPQHANIIEALTLPTS